MTDVSTSLVRQASLRLLLAVLVSILATIAAGVWILRSAADAAATRQLADASDYVSRRIAQLEQRWEAEAFALKTQIELARLTDDSQRAGPRLTSFFAALSGVGQFSAAVIRDRRGGVLFRYPAEVEVAGLPADRPGWFVAGPSATLYRVLHQPLWMGDAGMGSISLLRPLDNALLYQTAYPGTQLHLEWQGQILASSLGSSGIAGSAPSGRKNASGESARLEWLPDAPGPTVFVERAGGLPFDIGGVLVAGPVASIAVGALAWLLLSRWLRSTALRLGRVEAAVNRFDVDAGTESASDAAVAAEVTADEIGRLAQGTRAMMRGVVEARAAQARTQARLQELNASLELRVEQRTRELAASRDEADRANRAKSEFLSRMSHELRTPLNAILGFGQLLETDRELGDRRRAWLREIVAGGRHLLELINDVLDLARVESGKFTVSPESVALRPLIDECLTLLRPLADKGEVQLLSAAQHCDAQVRADRTRLKQVLLNLLSNAIKYNRPRGSVRIVCVAEAAATPPTVQVRITDSGPGLTAEEQARLFVPFERLHADKRQIEGTGIGLALSRKLLEIMDGEIGAESAPGAGSTFWLRLPLATGEEHTPVPPPAATAEPAGRDGGRRHDVLCIEDNPANLRLIESVFTQRPSIRLLTALAPGLGLELARTHRPALILLDINLPEMDGFSLMQSLRDNDGTRHIPVVAISANAMPRDLERGRAAGFAAYVTKPIDVRRLLELIDGLLPGDIEAPAA